MIDSVILFIFIQRFSTPLNIVIPLFVIILFLLKILFIFTELIVMHMISSDELKQKYESQRIKRSAAIIKSLEKEFDIESKFCPNDDGYGTDEDESDESDEDDVIEIVDDMADDEDEDDEDEDELDSFEDDDSSDELENE